MNALSPEGFEPAPAGKASGPPRRASRSQPQTEAVSLMIDLEEDIPTQAAAVTLADSEAEPGDEGENEVSPLAADPWPAEPAASRPSPEDAQTIAAAQDGPIPAPSTARAASAAAEAPAAPRESTPPASPAADDWLEQRTANADRAVQSRARTAMQPFSMPSQLATIEVTLSVQIGSHRLPLRDLLAISPGQLVPLDRMTTEPVDIFVNGRAFARGEVVAIGSRFGVRLLELVEAPDAG